MTSELERVLNAALEEFKFKGINFTMDDLASNIGISKKTLYQIVRNKKEVIDLIIEEARSDIKDKQKEILQDNSLDVVNKIQSILKVVPEFQNVFNFKRLLEIKKTYPSLYEKIIYLLNSDWEPTFELFKQGITEGKIAPINLVLFKEMYISSFTTVNEKSIAGLEDLSYKKIIDQIISILFNGILL